MSFLTHLIHQTGLDLALLADSHTPLVHANWMENLVVGLLLILGAAFIVQGAWNGLLTEFPRMGRLSYFRAIHMVAVGGVCISVLWYFFS